MFKPALIRFFFAGTRDALDNCHAFEVGIALLGNQDLQLHSTQAGKSLELRELLVEPQQAPCIVVRRVGEIVELGLICRLTSPTHCIRSIGIPRDFLTAASP